MWYPINKSSTAVAKIAEKDIPIIKVGTSLEPEIFISDYMAAEYRLNRLVPQVKIQPLAMAFNAIEKGYHFYKPNMVTIRKSEIVRSSDGSYPRYLRSRFTHPYLVHYVFGVASVIAKGFIPKGTVYYLNSKGEGVAEQIVLTEMIKL